MCKTLGSFISVLYRHPGDLSDVLYEPRSEISGRLNSGTRLLYGGTVTHKSPIVKSRWYFGSISVLLIKMDYVLVKSYTSV